MRLHYLMVRGRTLNKFGVVSDRGFALQVVAFSPINDIYAIGHKIESNYAQTL